MNSLSSLTESVWSNRQRFVAGGIGFVVGCAFYNISAYIWYKRKEYSDWAPRIVDSQTNSNDFKPNLDIPLLLEQEYGNVKEIFREFDPVVERFFQEVPVYYFNFPNNFAEFVGNALTNISHYTDAVVIGSGAGHLTFKLSVFFDPVVCLESSYSKVATCLQLIQSSGRKQYFFPLEGAQNSVQRFVVYPEVNESRRTDRSHKFVNSSIYNAVESPSFRYVDLNHIESLYPTPVQLIVIKNALEDIDDPIAFLELVKKSIQDEGVLIVSTTYSWRRSTNENIGLPWNVTTSFQFLRKMLEDTFDLLDEKHLPEILCTSARTATLRNNHCSVWIKNRNR